MQNSKIPIRATAASSKCQVISEVPKENRPRNVQQMVKLVEKAQNGTKKQSNPIPKDTRTMRDTGKDKNLKNELGKGKQVSKPDLKDKSKNTLKKKEDVKLNNNQVLKEQNKSKFVKSQKPSSWQQSKVLTDKDFELAMKNRKPPKPITIPQIQSASVSNIIQKKSENHRSQPDTEFEPDENCLKRILSGRELSPAALELPFGRAQSSFGRGFSNLNQPVRADPYKTLIKALENMAPESRRSSVRKQYFPGSPHLNTPYHCKSPKDAFQIAERRLTDIRLKEQSKSAKKVTFKLPNADLAQKISCQEGKVEMNQLRLTNISEKSDNSSQPSTPELDENLAKLLPSISNTSFIGQTPSMSSFKDMLRHCHQDKMQSLSKPDKKLAGILQSNSLTTSTDDERQEPKINASNVIPRKLRRSMSTSELDNCSLSKSSVLRDTSSKISNETDLKKFSQVQSSMSSYLSSNFSNLNALRTIGCPELKDKFSNCKLSNCDLNSGVEISSNIVAAALHERRESAILAFKSGRHRRSMSASEVDLVSDQNKLQDKPLESSNNIHTGRESNQVHNSMASYQFAKTCMLSSPELSDKFCSGKFDKCDPNMQNTGMKPSILKNNDVVADSCESPILANRPRKHRRSVSASSQLNCFRSDKNILKDKPLKSPNKIQTVGSNRVYDGAMASCQSVNTCNSKTQLSDRFFASKVDSHAPNMQSIRSTDQQSNIFQNIAAAVCDERRASENPYYSSFLRSRKLRSASASELSCASSVSAQTALKAELPGVDSVSSNNIGSSAISRPSFNARNFHHLRTSNSFPDLREKLSSVSSARKLENNNSHLYSVNKDSNFKYNNLQLSSVRAAELRSLYSSQRRNTIQSTCSPKLCTPCPVSLNPRSRVAESSFSPEFLCRRTSNIISHAPIRTPLVMRQLAAEELDDEDHHLSPVRQKLDFEPIQQKGKDDSKGISKAYLQTFKTQQVITEFLADQEVCIIMSYSDSFQHLPARELSNPIAKTLEFGDEMHFVPIDEDD